MKVLLIDGDQYLFKACAAVTKEVQWDHQNHVVFANAEEAWRTFTDMLERLFDRFETRECALAFSGEQPHFRLAVDPTYKAGRSPTKPLCYARLLARCRETYNVVSFPGLEGDDVLGILATKPGPSERILISKDKDMKTLPTTVWNGEHLITYTEAEADYWHLYQTLIGDSTDGYKGCPGIGPKKAEALLESCTVWESDKVAIQLPAWPKVVETYVKAGLTEADALTQARLARILRWSDWDAQLKKPILWTP